MGNPSKNQPPGEDPCRPHVYDGIQEYDKNLPNWWLITFYATIIFAIGYWYYYYKSGVPLSTAASLQVELDHIDAAKLASASSFDDATLWKMSRNPVFTDAGRTVFTSNCVSCHLPSLRGKDENPAAVGVNLADTAWIYGGRPADLLKIISTGTPKGMPAWGAIIGQKRASEAVAYVLSHHKEGEPVTDASAGNTPAAR